VFSMVCGDLRKVLSRRNLQVKSSEIRSCSHRFADFEPKAPFAPEALAEPEVLVKAGAVVDSEAFVARTRQQRSKSRLSAAD
jgi:hypothetical protein